jgi:large subunit ribosomal protein L29
MKAKDMREKSPEDLREMQKSLAHDAFQSKLKNFTNRLDDTSQIKKLRHDIARVKTILGELARKSAVPATATPAIAAKSAKSPKSAAAATAKAPAKKKVTKTAKAAHEATK